MSKERFSDLGPNHRRSIRATMRILDEILCEFEEVAEGRERKSLFFAERNDLSADQRRALAERVARMRAVMREVRDDLGFRPQREDLSQSVYGKASAFWVHLVETGARHLLRYGDMPEGFGTYLDPRIDALIEDLNAIAGIAHQHKEKRPRSS